MSKCEYCGKEHDEYRYGIGGGRKRFCSHKCSYSSRTATSKNRSGKKCVVCGKLHFHKTYCSRKCYADYRRGKKREMFDEGYSPPPTKPCRTCGETIPMKGKSALRLYCSRACYAEGKSKPRRLCPQCKVNHVKKPQNRFCSVRCANEAKVISPEAAARKAANMSKITKERFKNPDYRAKMMAHLERIRPSSKRGSGRTNIERAMARALDQIGVAYLEQFQVMGKFPDFAIPAKSLLIECDGPTHDTPDGRARDRERDWTFAMSSWKVVRIPGWEITDDPITSLWVRAPEIFYN